MLDAAEKLSGFGFAIHWLKPQSKAPVHKNWSSLPVLDFAQLKKTYRSHSNIGVRLGEPSIVDGYYLHCIDMDIRDPSHVNDAYKSLKTLFPNFASYPCVKSGSGGESRHFYFLSEKPFRSKKVAHSKLKFKDDAGHKHWFWEIEIFGTGKQTALPPSIHPDTGKEYMWLREFDQDMLDMGCGPVIAPKDVPSEVMNSFADDEDDEDSLLSLIRVPPVGLNEDEIRNLIFALPMEEWVEERDGWRNVGMAVHHETAGSDLGFKIWNDFSKRSTKFEMREQKIAWRSFNDDVSNPFTMHSIRKLLKVDGGDFEQCLQKLELCEKYRQAIAVAAEYDLSPSEIETILPKLAALASDGGLVAKLPAIKKDLTAARKEELKKAGNRRQKSLEDWVADEVLRVFYGAGTHLKRFNKSYWFYDRGVWRILDDEVVDNKVYLTIAQIIKEESESDGEGALQELLADSGRMDTMNSLTNSVSSLIQKKSANDGREDLLGLTKMHVPSIMNCKNGELWFDDDGDYDFKKHKPEHFLTHQIGSEFDPEADCPEWDAALQRIFSGHEDTDDVIRHLHEIMGYLIQPQRNIAAWIMFFGSGSNGKSFVASVLQEIMGAKAWVGKSLEDFAHSANSHIQAGLVGKLLLVDDDFKKGCMLPDSTLKKLSEAKAMTANPKNAGEFNFVCRSTPLILTNSWPKTNDMSYGLERRAEVFHFNTTISEQEKDMGLLRRIVEDELSGVLNRLIEGWVTLKSRGRLKPPESCERSKRAWMGKRNALSGFITDALIVTEESTDFIEATFVWEAFQQWSNMDNSGHKWGRNSFYDEIETLPGVKKYLKNGVNWFRGLKLVDLNPDFFDII